MSEFKLEDYKHPHNFTQGECAKCGAKGPATRSCPIPSVQASNHLAGMADLLFGGRDVPSRFLLSVDGNRSSATALDVPHQGLFLSCAGHGLWPPGRVLPVVIRISDSLNNHHEVEVNSSNLLRDPEDAEAALIWFATGFPGHIKITPATPSEDDVKPGEGIFTAGATPLGFFSAEGVFVGQTTEEKIYQHLHAYGQENAQDEAAYVQSTSAPRMLASYSSQQMVSGAGVFSKRNGMWIGTHLGGAAWWRSNTLPLQVNHSHLKDTQVLHHALVSAGSTTRYSFFLSARRVLRLLK